MNKTLVQLLHALISRNLKSWDDLMPYVKFAYNFPLNNLVSVDGPSKADLVKKLHKHVKERIEKQNVKVAKRMNRGCIPMVFQPEDWVWVHFRKERFPN